MKQKINWKGTIGGIILIGLIVWFGTVFFIGNIIELSTANLATALAFTAIVTYLVSRFL